MPQDLMKLSDAEITQMQALGSHDANREAARRAKTLSRAALVRLYNQSETLAEFGEAVALAVFGYTPERIDEAA